MARTVRNRKLSRAMGAESQLVRVQAHIDETTVDRILFRPGPGTRYYVVRFGCVSRVLSTSGQLALASSPVGSDFSVSDMISLINTDATGGGAVWKLREGIFPLEPPRFLDSTRYLGVYAYFGDFTGLADALVYADLLPYPSTLDRISGGGGVAGAGA